VGGVPVVVVAEVVVVPDSGNGAPASTTISRFIELECGSQGSA
jgi:hypothetical protein